MASRLETYTFGDIDQLVARLIATCSRGHGPQTCMACRLVGVIEAALSGDIDTAETLLQPGRVKYHAHVVSQSVCAGVGHGIRAFTNASTAIAPGGTTLLGEGSTADFPVSEAPAEHSGLTLDSSTMHLSKHGCFLSHCGRLIIPAISSYVAFFSAIKDEMPAILKAAAMGGSVPVLQAVLRVLPGVLDQVVRIRHPSGAPTVTTAAAGCLALNVAAEYGHAGIIQALYSQAPTLQADMPTLQMAALGGHVDAFMCLLGGQGLQGGGHKCMPGTCARRAVLEPGPEVAMSIVWEPLRNGHVSLAMHLMRLAYDKDGFDGDALRKQLLCVPDRAQCGVGIWMLLGKICEHGNAAQLKEVLEHPGAAQAFATPSQAQVLSSRMHGSGAAEEPVNDVHEALLFSIMHAAHSDPTDAAMKLRLLAGLFGPNHLQVRWVHIAHKAVDHHWAQGLQVIMLQLPPHHCTPRANAGHSILFRHACGIGALEAAEVLLQVPGRHNAVNPLARHQSAMHTACMRNDASVVRLLLRQTGKRAVRMQVGRRSFFYAALQPFAKYVPATARAHAHVQGADQQPHAGAETTASATATEACHEGYAALKLLLGATGRSAVPPAMWAHDRTYSRDDIPKHMLRPDLAARGPVQRLYRDVGWGGGIQRMPRRDMVLRRCRLRLPA